MTGEHEPTEAKFVRADERLVHKAPRDPLAVVEADEMRLEELASYSRRLGRLTNKPIRRDIFIGTGIAIYGAAAGAVISFGDWHAFGRTFVAWALVLATVFVTGGVFSHQERAESVGAIKEDFDHMLMSYEAYTEILEKNT